MNGKKSRLSSSPRLHVLTLAVLGCVTIWAVEVRGQARIGDVRTEPLVVLDTGGHNGEVRTLAFTPGGDRLLSAGEDKTIHVWDLRGGHAEHERVIRPPIWRGYQGAIYALALAPREIPGEPG